MSGMLDEVAVDRKRRLAVLGWNGFGKTSHATPAGAVPAPRFCRNRMSTTTSVPARSCIAPSGRRTAPIRSAIAAMCWRALPSTLSIVQRDVTKAARPPGRSRSTDRAMK